MNEVQDRLSPALTVADHETVIAEDESAARMITEGGLTDPTRKAITLAFETNLSEYVESNGLTKPDQSLTNDIMAIGPEQFEFGFSTAIDVETGTQHTTRPLKGNRPCVAPTGIPNDILNNQFDTDYPTGLPNREPSHQCRYTDFVNVHTHTFHTADVGLSAGDLKDNIPGSDELSSQRVPYGVYQAKGAIVFTDRIEHLPIDIDSSTAEVGSKKTHLFDQELPIRPWLHLIERTEQATGLSKSEANKLHYSTLDPATGVTESERYQELRTRLGSNISELVVPLAP